MSLDPSDFTEEFASYWSKTEGGKTVVSLVSPNGPSRTVSLWRSKADYYLADDNETLERWLRYSNPGQRSGYKFDTAPHLVLKRPILPVEYPRSGSGVLRFVFELAPDDAWLLSKVAEIADDKFTVSFEGCTDNGPVLFAVEVMPPAKQGIPIEIRPNMLERGFRPGKIPRYIRLQRLLGGNKVEHHEVERGDPSWIHGRDTPGIDKLFDKRVLMIGAGSLGSEVAQLLAKTGVGAITLVDPELLEFSNVGRHVLGVAEVRTSKSGSVAERLGRSYPHMRSIEHFREHWQTLYEKRPDIFHNADLIVSTVGSWLAESRLNQLARSDAALPPVLYGWTEPFSVAGHAILVGSIGACLSCGMNQFGAPLRTICEWDNTTMRKLPHCGASFQPYGPIPLANVAALVAKTTVKALLGVISLGAETVCWESHAEIVEQGGRFSAGFLKDIPGSPEFGGSHTFQWRQRDGCPICSKS